MGIKNIFHALKRLFTCKSSSGQLSGTIKFFDRKKRFGFIISGTNEYFFHAAATNPRDFKLLQDGAQVKFKLVQGKKGAQADQVEVI